MIAVGKQSNNTRWHFTFEEKTLNGKFMKFNDIPQQFSMTAILKKGKYRNFGILPHTASLYGHKASEILTLEFKISADQTKPVDKTVEDDFWVWFDFSDGKFKFLYPQWLLLDICFPCGIAGSENVGHGKALRVELLNQEM